NWGWPSIAALVIACAVGAILDLGKVPDGTYGPFLGEMLAFAIGFVGAIAFNGAARGRWKLIRRTPDWVDDPSISDAAMESPENFLECGLCHRSFVKQDMLTCPVAPGHVICSVCCSSHSTCGDACKTPPVFSITADELARERATGGVEA